jgi:hypothetical protein
VLWGITVWYSHRLGHAFCDGFPAVAAREIPFAFDRWFAHPEKAIFFFRRRAAEIIRTDPGLWCMRKRFIALSVASLVFPLCWFIPLFIYAVVMAKR